MSRTSYFVILLLGGILFAAIIAAPFFEVADTALIGAGASFDGDPPPCRPDRVGVTLALKGVPSVCQATVNGYAWTPAPAAQPGQAIAPRPASNAPEVCAYPPGRVGQRSKGMYTLANGRTVDGVCTTDGWKVAP